MILEGVITTLNGDGSLNVAPMGPIVSPDLSNFLLRPFCTSTTFANLSRSRAGVFHVVDEVLLIAQAVTGQMDTTPETFAARRIEGRVLKSCCRWFELEITEIDDSRDRTEMQTRILHSETLRDFFGFNRAKHAVIEAAILVSRLGLLGRETVLEELERLTSPVEKTAGPDEFRAFELLQQFVDEWKPSGDA